MTYSVIAFKVIKLQVEKKLAVKSREFSSASLYKEDQIALKYLTDGYAYVGNFITEVEAERVKEILEHLVDVPTYYDTNGLIRRMERFSQDGDYLTNLHIRIVSLLSSLFGEEYVMFKDKYNIKMPGGEGYFAHYDEIFLWEDNEGNTKRGWYEYTTEFINVALALDTSYESNGTIELVKKHDYLFDELLAKTKNNGTPALRPEIEKTIKFEKLPLKIGDVVIFSHKCPHRSAGNNSANPRGLLYYTYNNLKYGDHYNKYFDDKNSSNPGKTISKALSS